VFTAQQSRGLDCTPHFPMYELLLVVTEHATSYCECDRHAWQWRITTTRPSFDTFSVSGVFDTTPLNLLLKIARTAHPVLKHVPQSLLSRTQWFHNDYTHKCVSQCLILFVLSHVLGCHDVLFDLCPSIPHSVHVGSARLCFLALASSKPLLCHLCCLGRPAFCGSSGGYQRRGSCRSLRMYIWTSEYGCGKLSVDLCCVLWRSLQACTPNKSATKHTWLLYIHWGGGPASREVRDAPLVNGEVR